MLDSKEKILEQARVEALKRGSEEAFKLLYDRYSKKVYLLGLKLGMGREDAEGLVQDVFFKIWKSKEKLKTEFIFEVYLVKISKSIIFRKFERAKLEREYLKQREATNQIKNNHTEDYVIFEDLMSRSLEEVESLSPRQKQVFMMKNFDHLTLDEIADKLKVSKRTVENQIFRANQVLRKKMREMNFLSWFL